MYIFRCYVALEYAISCILSEKADVYSFRIIVLKLYVEKGIRLSVIFLPEVSPIHVLEKYFSFLMNQDRNL